MKVIIILILLFAGGCATSESPKMYDLLHREEANNLAYKSVTAEDYKGEDYNKKAP
jgi:hypothetical protein